MNEKDGVLFFNDTKGECRACLNVNEKSSSLYCCDANGECHGGFGVYEDGKVGPRFSAAQKDRDIKLGAGNDGNLYFMLTDEGAPMLGLRLD